MRISVRVHGDLALGEVAVGQTMELPNGVTALDLLRMLSQEHPKLLDSEEELPPDINVLVNGRSLRGLNGIDTALAEGDRLHILRAFGGG